ncbi:MAG: putative ABC transport system ATP-binding protein [Kiritimatiellia bacterium]|jgi:putative ABC transport system ATP-binding protein
MPVIDARGICKSYAGADGEVNAVRSVDFVLEAGDFVALHGPSGCGKSTLLMITGALLSPDAGTLHIAEQDPYAMNANGRASFRATHIGFVFQQFHLIPYLNVIDNVSVPALAANLAGAEERAGELLEHFQLGHRLHHVPSALSVGEQQRVALARALLHKPAVLLADEPTGNLDPENAELILKYMQGFAQDGGAVLMVTHDDRAKAAAGRQLELREGSLV